ncbi:MAG: hypothetical protein ACLP4V_33595 [Methylocella sp.]
MPLWFRTLPQEATLYRVGLAQMFDNLLRRTLFDNTLPVWQEFS